MTLGGALANNSLTVQVRKSGNPVAGHARRRPGRAVARLLPDRESTNGSGNITFEVPRTLDPCTVPPQASASCYTVTAWNAAGTGTGQALNVKVPSNQTITVNVP